MKKISVEEIKTIEPEEYVLLDIRPEEEFKKGSINHAINIPATAFFEDFDRQIKNIDKSKTVYVLCHTGEQSMDLAERLAEEGFDAWNITGGYRSFLRLELDVLVKKEDVVANRTAEIERSIIKKFRKQIWSRFTKAIKEYQLVQEGDKIAVCISGGKDSVLLAKCMEEIKKHGKVNFEVVFIVMNPGYNDKNLNKIIENAKILGIEIKVFDSDIFSVVNKHASDSPCYLCARMRRGFLYDHAKQLGCNKIALGHHFDDVVETILLSMLYGGEYKGMMPKLKSTNFEGMELIRPLYLVREDDIIAWKNYNKLDFINCACKFTEKDSLKDSKRLEIKLLI